MVDPPAGVASSYNHPLDRYGKAAGQPAPSINEPVYREPSTWETMMRAELGAGEHLKASALLKRVEARAFPEGGTFVRSHFAESELTIASIVMKRMRSLCEGLGLETLPLP